MKLGDFEVHLLVASRMAFDGGLVFGAVPKKVWERYKPADENNLVQLACNGLVIRMNGKVVVCETGFGTKLDAKRAGQVRLREPEGHLAALQRLGIRPEEVDVVLATHLHWDHAGGMTRRDGDHLQITFPRARHFLQRKEFDFALNCDPRSRAAYLAEDFLPAAEEKLVEFVDGDAELLPGLEVRFTAGHTPGNQVIVVKAGDATLALTGDLIGTTEHLRPAWNAGGDLDVVRSLEEKGRLVRDAADSRWLVVLGHEPQRPAGYVEADGSWTPEPELSAG